VKARLLLGMLARLRQLYGERQAALLLALLLRGFTRRCDVVHLEMTGARS
jgi:hypothetical protein